MAGLRYMLWALIFVLGAILACSTMTWTLNNNQTSQRIQAAVGGDFVAQNVNGQAFTHDDMKGRPHVLFFGFTHCPDVCPTAIYEATQWVESMGEDGKKLDVYFATVDPTRDTAEVMKSYLSSFGGVVKGITGSQEQMGVLQRKWRVFAEKVPLEDDDYTMNHTATTFLMKADGSFFGTIAYGENIDTARKKLARLVAASS